MNKLAILALTLIFATPAFGQQAFEIYVSDAGNFQAPPWQILKFDANGENPEVFIDPFEGFPFFSSTVDGEAPLLGFGWMNDCRFRADHDGFPENGGAGG